MGFSLNHFNLKTIMDFKAIGMTALGVVIGLIAYDMFVKKALKIESFEEDFDDLID